MILNKFTFQQQVVASIEKERKKLKKKLSLLSVEEASDAGVEPLWDPNPVDRVTYNKIRDSSELVFIKWTEKFRRFFPSFLLEYTPSYHT